MQARRRSIAVLALLRAGLIMAVALGAAIADDSPEQVTVDRDGTAYTVTMSIELDAPPGRVLELLTDYAHLSRINPSVVESEVLPSQQPDVTRVRTRLKSCVWFFCRALKLVEDLRTEPGGQIHARIVAELSDMKAGSTHWHIAGAGGGTHLSYQANMEPGFWVPPLVGPRAIARNLRENLLATAANLERLARDAGASGTVSAEN